MMTLISPTGSDVAGLDSAKRVRYSQGMLLGYEDFNQEFAYLSGRDQWLARDMLGYGTVCGLQVLVEPTGEGPRVRVKPGAALTPRGQLVRVPDDQCADLKPWISRHQSEVRERLSSPPADYVSLYLTLCYRECPTDDVPIPGEPCRDESEAMVASRFQDDFHLQLAVTPPDQREEMAIRDFVAWLSAIPVVASPGTGLPNFLAALRNGRLPDSPPTSPPDFMLGSPPGSLTIPADRVCDYLRAAFRVWVTELRPHWLEKGLTCVGGQAEEECVLLAELRVPLVPTVQAGWAVDDGRPVEVREDERPYLLPLRMLQEWLLCGRGGDAPSVGSPPAAPGIVPATTVKPEQTFGLPPTVGTATTYAREDHTHGTPPAPSTPPSVTPGNTVRPEQNFGQAPNAGTAAEYARADHTHGTPPAPASLTPATTVRREQSFGLSQEVGTAATYAREDHTHGTPPDPIPPHRADPNAHTLAGDVTGPVGTTRVTALHSRPIDNATAPANNQVLTFRNNRWVAADPSSPPDPIPPHQADPNAHTLGGEVTGPVSNTTVTALLSTRVTQGIAAPANGQVLTVVNGEWQAADPRPGGGNFVGFVPTIASYAIVAAGIVGLNTQPRRPIYNSLTVTSAGLIQGSRDIRFVIKFDGYQRPDGRFMYIVKALPVYNVELKGTVQVSFEDFTDEGIVLRGNALGNAAVLEHVGDIELMLEISLYISG